MNTSVKPATATTGAAAKRIGVSSETVRRWCEETGFGIKIAGRWYVPEAKIAEIEQKLLSCSMPTYGEQR